jgi:hypothetical protein
VATAYYYCLHLLLAFIKKYPELQTMIDARVQRFVDSEAGRIKKAEPNLGEFLALMAASSLTWDDISQVGARSQGRGRAQAARALQVLVRETFDRNARWTIAASSELVDLMPEVKFEKVRTRSHTAPLLLLPPAPLGTSLFLAPSRRSRRTSASRLPSGSRPIAAASSRPSRLPPSRRACSCSTSSSFVWHARRPTAHTTPLTT